MDALDYRAHRAPDRRVWRESSSVAAETAPEVRIVVEPGDAQDRERPPGELEMLERLAGARIAHADERGVVLEVLELAAQIVDSNHPIVFLGHVESDSMEAHSLAGSPKVVRMSAPNVIRRVLTSGAGEIVNDAAVDPDVGSLLPSAGEVRQVIAAPLTIAGRRTGVLAAFNSNRGAFVDRELRMLTVLADRAAILVENTRLESTVERQGQELTGLHRLSRVLAAAETVEQAIEESVRIVTDLLVCGRTVVLLFDEDLNELIVRPPAYGLTGQDVSGMAISLATPSLLSTVFRTATPLVSNDASADAWVGNSFQRTFDIDSLLVVPLTAGSRSIGVLAAANAAKGAFDDDDLRFTTLLGARIGTVIEASESRERERDLLQELREADRTRTEFVSMLAHELKGPMTTIKGFADILQRHSPRLDPSRRTEYFDIVTQEIDRLSTLVNDLLDVARMDAGTLRSDLQPTDLPEIVADLLEVHSSLTDAHRIESAMDDNLPRVMADKDRIRQVLLNLLQNATRYSPSGSTVTVEATVIVDEEQRWVRVAVADEGIGVPEEDRERVFGKFVMLPKPDWAQRGTGLGLFISKGIVEAHGGRIWVESEPGRGSTFFFTLRVAV
jgi:signal transduction histidine kinase